MYYKKINISKESQIVWIWAITTVEQLYIKRQFLDSCLMRKKHAFVVA
jgi:hypothetical protein